MERSIKLALHLQNKVCNINRKILFLILKAKSLTRLSEAPPPRHTLAVTSINFLLLADLRRFSKTQNWTSDSTNNYNYLGGGGEDRLPYAWPMPKATVDNNVEKEINNMGKRNNNNVEKEINNMGERNSFCFVKIVRL